MTHGDIGPGERLAELAHSVHTPYRNAPDVDYIDFLTARDIGEHAAA